MRFDVADRDPGRVWFTSDTHFGHGNIIRLCCRPFHDVQEMDWAMEEGWNERVRRGDLVFFLGDFSFASRTRNEDLLARLHGEKVLVRGNHDGNRTRACGGWSAVFDYVEIVCGEDAPLVLSHYPIEDWNGKLSGVLHLHGHSHGRAPEMMGRMDVGVDPLGFSPISLAEVRRKMLVQDVSR